MKTKPLNLLTMDQIQLNRCYTQATPGSTNPTYVGAFGRQYTSTNSWDRFNEPRTITNADIQPRLNRIVKTLGCSIEFELVSKLGLWNKTLDEIRVDYPKIADAIAKLYTKGWLESYNQIIIDERKAYTDKVDKLHNEMVTIHTDLNYPGDLATLSELEDLLYCEAAGFLDKMEEKINKKSNPKNLKLYKALQALREEPIITCESA